MSLDLAFDHEQVALADALTQFCRERCGDDVVRSASDSFPRALWSELASLGVLAAGAPCGEGGPGIRGEQGGALEICAAMEALGRAAFPGPLAETFLAMQVLDADVRAVVSDGQQLVSCGTPPLMPFAPIADVFIEIADDALYRAEPDGAVEPVEVLGGEPWGRLRVKRMESFANARRAIAIGEMARAAQLAALAERLVEDVAEHARTRRQFGRSIGEFQAVAHPLADCAMRLAAGRTLARSAAWWLDAGDLDAADRAAASASLACAASAVDAAHVAHQIYGAVGITLEGPAFHLTRRIRQLSSQPSSASRAREHLLERLGLAAA